MQPMRATLSTSEPGHIASLDGLRAVAVSIVFLSHAGFGDYAPAGFGVTIFFFLSGYLITTLLRVEWQRRGRISLRDFYLRRALRILPPMYLALAGAVLASLAVAYSMSGFAVLTQALHLTNYHTIFWAGEGQPIGTTVFWSLAVEEHFYILVPLLFVTLLHAKASDRAIAWVLLALALGVLAWRFLLVLHFEVPTARDAIGADRIRLGSDTRIDSILYGCILAMWRNPALPGPQWSDRALRVGLVLGVPLLLATMVAKSPQFRETVRYSLQGVALFPIFIAAIRYHDAYPFRILNWAWVRRVGVYSYVIYLVHFSILEVFRLELPHVGTVAIGSLSLVSSLSIAYLMHRYVEAPLARVRKRLAHVETTGGSDTSWVQIR
jgi:peptidoglycan/LPS O-acetylase OafA/YrhL